MHLDLGLEYRHLTETESTNDYLRTYVPSADITVVSASFQTKGRGQMGNTWVSLPGQNLLFSVLVCPIGLKASDGFVLSQAMALSIKEVLECYIDDVSIKWPNDIYCGGEKICGTLIENSLMGKSVGRSVIGSGINVNQVVFPEGLAAPATSIRLRVGRELDPSGLLRRIVDSFAEYYREILMGNYERIRESYHEGLYLRGEKVRFEDERGQFYGAISHVEPDGHLVVVDDVSCSRRYVFKQVKLIR